ncbi:hypothetical protein M0R45_003143 [Rubus argutus]|uniref:Uncharacterized protein n=1 Tax=Rubus argutus TaxID=59490 RepID=A0AAW1YFJ6_RUBAR
MDGVISLVAKAVGSHSRSMAWCGHVSVWRNGGFPLFRITGALYQVNLLRGGYRIVAVDPTPVLRSEFATAVSTMCCHVKFVPQVSALYPRSGRTEGVMTEES